MAFSFIILFLYLFQGTGAGVRGAKFTLVNNCSEIVWPAILGQYSTLETAGFELSPGNSVGVQVPSNGWRGRVWGRTGCTFNASGYGSCVTGDCGSGQLECKTNASANTLVELALGGINSLDFYDVSLINGFNLPLLLRPTAQCQSTGCTEDLNRICPSELRTQGGSACQSACEAFNTSEYCCRGTASCGPTSYSRLFKEACPNAYSYTLDDANTTFSCSGSSDYFITFCPTSLSQTANGMPPVQSPSYPPQSGGDPTASYKPPDAGQSSVILIVGVILGSVMTVIGIIALIIIRRRCLKRRLNQGRNQDVEKFLLQNGLAPKRYKNSEIKKVTKSFDDKLGKGGYGSVYKGTLPDGSLVAVKVLIETDSDGEEFINEVASISKTSHVNIVGLLGFCYENNKRALVYEYMPNKSLDKFLNNKSSADCGLDLKKMYEIAVGIAKGLEYLHTGCSTRIVHFDIKPQNILLDEDLCPKISDFGLAKLCKKKQSVLSVLGTRGTIGYIAPEVFSRNFGGVSYKSDVYSYGMMVLEMAGGNQIIEANTLESSENYFPDEIYKHVIHDGDAEEITQKMLLVGFWCIQTTPSDRPPMSKVVEMLEGSVESIQIPPKPVLFTPTPPLENMTSSLWSSVEAESSAEGETSLVKNITPSVPL